LYRGVSLLWQSSCGICQINICRIDIRQRAEIQIVNPERGYPGSGLSARKNRQAANLGSIGTPEDVIGQDNRVQVVATGEIPWRWICELLVRFPDGSAARATGWFSGPHTVMTAGHVVFSRANGGWAQAIEVIPGMNAATRPFGSRTGTQFRSVTSWIRDMDPEYDYGAILLPDDELGMRVGWFGFSVLDDQQLRASPFSLSGYPADKPLGTQWVMNGTLTAVEPRRLRYVIDTFGGQSGSPVWRSDNGQYRVVGIHAYGESENGATRIVPQVYQNMVSWKA
jgi:V8-like Glu-specific endopeptidase